MSRCFIISYSCLIALIFGVACILMLHHHNKRQQPKIMCITPNSHIISTRIDVFSLDTGRYPTSMQELVISPDINNWQGPYIRGEPENYVDQWGTPIKIMNTGTNKYALVLAGPDKTFNTSEDIIIREWTQRQPAKSAMMYSTNCRCMTNVTQTSKNGFQ